MKTNEISLPSNMSEARGARAGHDWILCWSTDRAAAWSPKSGWKTISDGLPGEITFSHATSDGILLISRESGCAGFWLWGSESWSWWTTIDGLGEAEVVYGAGDRVVFHDFPILNTKLHILEVSPERLNHLAAFSRTPPVRLVCAGYDESSGDLLLALHPSGIFRLGKPYDSGTLREQAPISLTTWDFSWPSIAVGSQGFVFPVGELCQAIDMMTGEVRPTRLAYLPGCEALWQSFATGKFDRVRFVLDSLRLLPSTEDGLNNPLFCHTTFDDLTLAAASPRGISVLPAGWRCEACSSENTSIVTVCRKCGTENRPRSTYALPTVSVADRLRFGIATWLLAVDPANAVPSAVEMLLDERGPSAGVLAGPLDAVGGVDSLKTVLEHARGRETEIWLTRDFQALQDLVRLRGTKDADLVRAALRDDDPAVVTVALAAAATLSDSGEMVLWEEDEEVPDTLIRPLLSHWSPTVVRLAARACGKLEIASCQQDLGKLLNHEFSAVRQAAINSLAVFRSGEWLDRLSTLIVADPSEDVRETAVLAVLDMSEGLSPEHYRKRFLVSEAEQIIPALIDVGMKPCEAAWRVAWQKHITPGEFRRVVEMAALRAMTSAMGIDDTTVARESLRVIGEECWQDACLLGPQEPYNDVLPYEECLEYIEKVRTGMLAILFIAPLLGELVLDDFKLDDTALSFAYFREEDSPIREGEIRDSIARATQEPPLDLLQKVITSDQEIARILAGLALYHQEQHSPARSSGPGSGEKPGGPASQARKREDGPVELFQICDELLSRRDGESDVGSLALLLALGSAGDEAAQGELADRIVSGSYAGCNVLVGGYLKIVDEAEKTRFAEEYLTSDKVPLGVRLWNYSYWDIGSLTTIPDTVISTFLRLCSDCSDLPQADRDQAAGDLADRCNRDG